MEIIAAIAAIATIISAIVGIVALVRTFRTSKRSKEGLGRNLVGMIPINLPFPRPRKRRESFDQVVDPTPSIRPPKSVWPPDYEKAVIKPDIMDRRPYPTTDATRPIAGGEERWSGQSEKPPFDPFT